LSLLVLVGFLLDLDLSRLELDGDVDRVAGLAAR
jgi:hypothetical protein